MSLLAGLALSTPRTAPDATTSGVQTSAASINPPRSSRNGGRGAQPRRRPADEVPGVNRLKNTTVKTPSPIQSAARITASLERNGSTHEERKSQPPPSLPARNHGVVHRVGLPELLIPVAFATVALRA